MMKKLISLAAIAALCACSTTTAPMSTADFAQRAAKDAATLTKMSEPVTRPISLEEAIARAVRGNLDVRVARLRTAFATNQADLATFDMLPKVTASAGYTARSNDQGGVSQLIEPPKTVSLSPSSTVERRHHTADLGVSWNILDFGASYFRAKMLSDQAHAAAEDQRKAVQQIAHDVRAAFFKALAAQRLEGEARASLDAARKAQQRAADAANAKALDPADALAYAKALNAAETLLQGRLIGFERARLELAALMNLKPGTAFVLADTALSVPSIDASLNDLDELALKNRAELRSLDYTARANAADARRAVLAALPGISLDFGGRYDSNKFLYNNGWSDATASIGLNLFKLASIPSIQRTAQAQADVDQARRLAMSAAVIVQNRLAAQQYGLAVQQMETATRAASLAQRIKQTATGAKKAGGLSELEFIRTSVNATLAEADRAASEAEAAAAFGYVVRSLGLDVSPELANAETLDVATAIAAQNLSGWKAAFTR